MKTLQLVNKGDKSAELLIYDIIGQDFWGGGGVTAKGFSDQLTALGELDSIDVRINSPGGKIDDATAIYNALVRHPAKVNVYIDGLAASAASWIAMAGDKICMAENALMMIHPAQGGCMGAATDMDKTAEILRKCDQVIANTYAKRAGRKAETFLSMMQEETWFTAQEAKDNKLVDEIMPAKKAAANFNLSALDNFSKRPDRLAAMFEGGNDAGAAVEEDIDPNAANTDEEPTQPAGVTTEAVAVRLRILELEAGQ